MKPQLVIPMTGVSARFTAAGYPLPKFLLDTDGETVIDHVIDMYPGWDDVVFICNAIHLDDRSLDLERRLLARRPNAVVVRIDGKGDGPGDAVLRSREHIDPDRPVVVNYCDFAAVMDSEALAERLSSGEVDGVIPCYTGFHPHMAHSTSYAYVRLTDGVVTDIQEKQPWTDDPLREFASSGTYGFASGRLLLESLDQQVADKLLLAGEYYLSLAYKPLLANGGKVEVLQLQHFMQWGTPQDFEEYRDASRAFSAWTGPRMRGDKMAHASRVVLASGAGQRFLDAGYGVPKPALPLGGATVLEHALAAVPGHETVVVTRLDLPQSEVIDAVAANAQAAVVRLPGLSQGQADSARQGIAAIQSDGPVTVAACDAIPTGSSERLADAVRLAGEDGLVVWLASPYHLARRSPKQYGWAAHDSAGHITRTWLKEDPGTADAGVVIGTFTFGSRAVALRMIDELMADDERIRGEFYLDSLIARQLRATRPVVAFTTETFSAVGTPVEYETLRYWQSCFHKWPLHPYSVAADPLVPATRRADLDHAFQPMPSNGVVSR